MKRILGIGLLILAALVVAALVMWPKPVQVKGEQETVEKEFSVGNTLPQVETIETPELVTPPTAPLVAEEPAPTPVPTVEPEPEPTPASVPPPLAPAPAPVPPPDDNCCDEKDIVEEFVDDQGRQCTRYSNGSVWCVTIHP